MSRAGDEIGSEIAHLRRLERCDATQRRGAGECAAQV